MRSGSLVAATSMALVLAATGCSRAPVEAESAVRVVFSQTALNIDSRSSCVVRVSPVEDDEAVGSVVDCPGASGTPVEAVVPVPVGRFLVEVGQWGCPGMPGDCPEDPFDDHYAGGPDGGAVWTCSTEVVVDAGGDVTIEATGPFPRAAPGSTSAAACEPV